LFSTKGVYRDIGTSGLKLFRLSARALPFALLGHGCPATK
jgi:hypothetical protein